MLFAMFGELRILNFSLGQQLGEMVGRNLNIPGLKSKSLQMNACVLLIEIRLSDGNVKPGVPLGTGPFFLCIVRFSQIVVYMNNVEMTS